jgi:HEAT repeat protein
MNIRTYALCLLSLAVAIPSAAADPVSQLKQFREAKVEQRVTLVDQLARKRIDTTEEATLLQAALVDPSPEVRWRAARAWSGRASVSEQTIAALVNQLDDPNEQVRVYAAYALGNVGSSSATAAQALVEHVNDEAVAVQRESMKALQRMQVDPALLRPVLSTALTSQDSTVVAAAAQIMASLGEAGIDDVKAALADEKTRYWATLAVQEMGPLAAETVEPLRDILQSKYSEERLEAALALAAIGEPARMAAPELTMLLKKDSNPGVRLAAAYALGQLEVKTTADDALTVASTSDNPTLRLVSTWALHRIYPDNQAYSKATAKLILEGIQSDDAQLRSMAARTLTQSKIPLDKATPYIAAALKYSNPVVVEHAVKAILEQGEESLTDLQSGLNNAELQISTLKLIQRLGPKASRLVDEVRGLTASDNATVRREALFTLAAMGDAATTSVDEISKAYLAGTTREDRLAAIYAAGRVGPAAKAMIPSLQELSADAEDPQMQVAATWALARIAPDNEQGVDEAVAAMINALSDTNRDNVKIALANSLGELGARSEPAIPVLTKLSGDLNSRVQLAAKAALKKITGR